MHVLFILWEVECLKNDSDSDELDWDKAKLTETLDFFNLLEKYIQAGVQSMMEPQTIKRLQDEITWLKTENRKILEWVGETMVEETAKVNEKRRSELFQQIFRSNNRPINDRLHSTQDDENLDSNSSASPRGFPKPQTINESAGSRPANAPVTAAPVQQSSLGAEALVEEGSPQDEIENQGLPLSIQQDDSNGREYISLGNIPPTSVATVVYNNYKLLLLSLGHTLDSFNVVQLMQWAQNFSIENAQNTTDVFFQLDEKRVINASDLSQLCDFFSSISRMDLVHIIHKFLLGDYSLLHQIPSVTPTTMAVDGPVTDERRTTATDGTASPSTPLTSTVSNTGGSNGSKLSKFQRRYTGYNDVTNPMSPSVFWDLGQSQGDDDYSCSHYKRHCHVKFECCNYFWPCHRCHNDQSTCGRRKITSRDTKMVKCVYCDKVQQFGQFCCDCGAKFAEYFCDLCKHLTGKDNHPYHCEKCGICRVHGDCLFHCDVCGLCLDVQLRGNHKCREGSVHECCICLEDAFTGCQILPCSHKVHKDCATQTISSGMVHCPIIVEGRQLPNSRKRTGK
ncbi:RING finger and CHY zinc finger domain-containing 1-like [Paramuricea clavata]|uniref:RING finger and CHY zinc finger domain-containing 1-like n=1 Tax=Paramuricea clavata TaxID=317549 RepID=A0A6S7GYD3_PARCT|nr:RING finger and CHY zinc finger domain-containing 1-like [Paramuricea clavata]